MGILSDVLEYKKQKEAQESADLQAIPQALAAFQQGRQQAQKNYLDQLTMQMQLQKFQQESDLYPLQKKKLEGEISSQGLSEGLTAAKQGLREVQPIEARMLEDRALLEGATESDIAQKPITVGGKTFTLDPRLGTGGVDLDKNPDMMLAGYTANGKPYYKSKTWNQFQREVVTENPIIDVDTQKAIAGYNFAEPRIKNIERLIDSGTLGDEGTFKKLANEVFIKGSGAKSRYVVPDGSPLESLMSDVNAIKTTGFSIAGTAYTDTERENIEYGLDPRGKSASQYRNDIRIIQDYLVEKARAGTIGLKEARKQVSGFEGLSNRNGDSKMVTISNGKETRTVTEEEARKLGAL